MRQIIFENQIMYGFDLSGNRIEIHSLLKIFGKTFFKTGRFSFKRLKDFQELYLRKRGYDLCIYEKNI